MLIFVSATNEKRDKTLNREMSEASAVKLVTGIFEKFEHMETTCAGLKALKFIKEVSEGTDKTIKNSLNGRTLSFRRI